MKTIFETNNSSVIYESEFFSPNEADFFYDYFLHNLVWQNDEAVIYGKHILTKRKIAWFADSEFNYNYSGSNRIAQSWNTKLKDIKEQLKLVTGYSFNSCLLNLYHTGNEGMAWHSDDQNHLVATSPVVIISLGAERFFKLRETHNKLNQYKVILEHGSILIMRGETQKYWQHEIPKMARLKESRISLTWRNMK